ncbi:MAG TPA: restriction endonuclease subunit S [Candidatus Competibacteraceae bacterium]|nr:restriction endonuclease subunit S [Candidatus Competibacteraceae bacterium]
MEVKPGYKLTEVGVIPEDWDVLPLGSITSLLTNGFVGTATSAYVDDGEGVLYIQGFNVQENGFNFYGIKRVSRLFHLRNQKSCLQEGDLLTIQTGDIGVTAVVSQELVGANCHALIISRPIKSGSDPHYYSQYFNSERGRSAIKKIETGTTMKHLNCGDMRDLLLPLPPLPEQRAIAAALSDVDALLDGLDRLIAKKRNLKQAAMQQLLTGQTRLPGFSGVWEVKRLGELVSLYQPETISAQQFNESGFPVYGANGVVGYYHKPNHTSWQITVTCRGSTCGTVNRTVEYCWITGNAMVLNCDHNQEVIKDFLYYLMLVQDLTGCITGTGQPQIVRPPLAEFKIYLPIDHNEQTAIAAILSDMDTEIAALEARRDKTRALKQGMMQELLTGRIRLV